MDPISVKTLIQPAMASVASGASRAFLLVTCEVKQIGQLWGRGHIHRESRDLCSRFKALYGLEQVT